MDQALEIVLKMNECRDTARRLFSSEDYTRLVKNYRQALFIVISKEKCGVIQAAIILLKNGKECLSNSTDYALVTMWTMAAALDISEEQDKSPKMADFHE